MPLYDYRCTQCGYSEEVRHTMRAVVTMRCLTCGASMRKAPSAPPVHFHGSGFYVTDSKRTSED